MLRQDTVVAHATAPSKRRLQALIDYVAQTARARSKVVSNVTDHGLFLLFEHQLATVDGSRLNDVGADGEDEIWLTVSRPPGPDLPPRPDNPWLAPWLAVGIAVLVAPKLVDAVDGIALIAAGTHRDGSAHPSDMDSLVRPAVRPEARVELRDYAYRAEVEKQYTAYMDDHWVPWADGERRRRRLSRLYVRLFTLHQQMSGSLLEAPVELVWGLALGVVDVPGTPAAYPLLTQLVDLSVNARTGAVEIRPRDVEPRIELDTYAALDRSGAERAAAQRAEQAGRQALHQAEGALSPFHAASYEPVVAAILAALAHTGERRASDLTLVGSGGPEQPLDMRVSSGWVLFARPRSSNLLVHDLEQYRRALQDMADEEALPDAVRALVSDPATDVVNVDLPRFRGVSTATTARGMDVEGNTRDLFFPKPFNDEQLRIVQLLEAHDGVVVQGPPGTGKTHTIANIICHWLATGRRVLVTSMKEPALAVLRENLPEQIRPLAISLLGSEHEGMRQFEQSVQHIASEVQSIDQTALEAEVAQLEELVDGLHGRLARMDTEIGRWARLNQARIDIDGESLSPMDAAQEIIDRAEQYEWIPDALGIGPQYAPRFGDEDMARLREARRQLGADIEYVAHELPVSAEFPDARALLQMHQGLAGFARMNAEARADRPQLPHDAEAALEQVSQAVARVRALRAKMQDAGMNPGARLQARLRSAPDGDEFKLLEGLAHELSGAAELRTAFLARPVDAPANADQDAELVQAVQNLASGRRAFGLIGGFRKAETRRMMEAVVLDAHAPAEPADWQHVLGYLNLQQRLRRLAARWNALAEDLGLAPVDASQPQQVMAALDQVAVYRAARDLAAAEAELARRTLALFPAWPQAARVASDNAALAQLERTIAHQHTAQRLGEVWVAKARLQKALEGRSGRVVEDLRVFVNDVLGNPKVDEGQLLAAWGGLMAELARLQRVVPWLQTVASVTQRVALSGAPQYARMLLQPAADERDALAPQDWRRAWRLRCLATHLSLIDPQNEFRRLTRVRGELEQDLARSYRDLVVRSTWLQLARNTSASTRAALQAYLNAIQRIGKGTGKRAARYRQDAREAAAEAHAAVPCWIMPHYRVSETLPAQMGMFDLVIIDEASQSDLSALPTLFRGRKLLIVGDDKQVAPEAIGMEEERIKALMQRHLAEQVPLYRAQMSADRSIYDLAKVVFARSGVMLKEHFRCVAPIIEYSRREFYHGELLPLRLPPLALRLDPPLIDVLVEDGERKGDTNLAEARYIVDEIKHLLGDARMRHRTIGVVSLLGDEQPLRIWDMLGEELGPEAMQRFQIACGDARTFQGRERDVMFLTMVCAPNDVGAPLSRDSFAQRFNVAASRARDRMYLVRSVELHHLPDSDRLRRRLIEHFAAPFPLETQVEGSARADPRAACESPLEREIYDWLSEAGYRVSPQVRVGTYRIDLVVDGTNQARLAIECDGDKHHGPDKWSADARRQRVLERAGWTFWRCFASTFVRRRQAVLDDLARTLDALDIRPMERAAGEPPTLSVHRRVRTVAAR